MKKRLERKSFKKTILAGTVLIGVCTLLFQGFTHAAMEAELKATTTIPTSYGDFTTGLSQVAQNSLPDGYKTMNYTVGDIDLEYFHNQTPTSKDMTKEEAAEIGAQALWEVFGLNLEDQVIEMGYQQATESLSRSSWTADVLINGERSYYFIVDSVTGELFSIAQSRTLNDKVSVAFDEALNKNPQEYVVLAKKLAEKYNIVHGAVKSVEYNGQGYSDNDPTISVDITGDNGEIALMSFSRYDKALLGIIYSAQYKPEMEFHEKFVNKVQEEVNEFEKSTPSTNENEAPTLQALQ